MLRRVNLLIVDRRAKNGKTKKFLLPCRLYFGIDIYRCNKIIKEIYINIVTKLNARVHIFKHIEKNRGQDIKTVILSEKLRTK